MNDALLKKYFEFDEADLFTNRSGGLTDKQRKRLAENDKFARKVFLIAGIVVLGIAILPSLVIWLTSRATEEKSMMFLIIWSVVWIPLWTFFGVKVIRMGEPHKDLMVKKAEGEVNIVKEESYNSSMKRTVDDYELHIGGKTFEVDSELADVIMQGDTYAIYYINGTDEILSAEKIAGHRGKNH